MKPKETIPVFLLGHPEYGRYMEEYGKKKKTCLKSLWLVIYHQKVMEIIVYSFLPESHVG